MPLYTYVFIILDLMFYVGAPLPLCSTPSFKIHATAMDSHSNGLILLWATQISPHKITFFEKMELL